ncbi:hypothetical protein SeMB42_g07846 [Synchytrium endobioticum]|nr:hypothetical protein SeMB42_g07846 [Synchytrium endobioticum]
MDRTCAHQTVFHGLCANCGQIVVNDKRKRFNVAHDTKGVYVDAEEAKRLQREAAADYHKTRRLPLILDLDLTIIQACVEKDTIEEWKSDPNNPNHPALSDPTTLTTFQLAEAGAHTYYVKLRPKGRRFLDAVSKLFELHIYTMGTEPYARKVAEFLDPSGVIFADRILSRDTSGSNMVKSIDRLFPYGHDMVVVVDDRADVWNHLPNVVRVMPFDFFKSVGDVNAPMIAAAQQLEKIVDDSLKPPTTSKSSSNTHSHKDGLTESDRMVVAQAAASKDGDDPQARENRIRHAVEAVEDENLKRLENAKPLKRASLSLQQQKLVNGTSRPLSTTDGSSKMSYRGPSLEPAILVEDDQELEYIERVLLVIHDTYFRLYDAGYMPNVAAIMKALRKTVFAGCGILFSSIIPITLSSPEQHEMYKLAEDFGATIVRDFPASSHEPVRNITHVVAGKLGTDKVLRALKAGVPVVKLDWLTRSAFRWRREPIEPHLLDAKAPIKPREPPLKSIKLSEGDLISQGATQPSLSSIAVNIDVDNGQSLHHIPGEDLDNTFPKVPNPLASVLSVHKNVLGDLEDDEDLRAAMAGSTDDSSDNADEEDDDVDDDEVRDEDCIADDVPSGSAVHVKSSCRISGNSDSVERRCRPDKDNALVQSEVSSDDWLHEFDEAFDDIAEEAPLMTSPPTSTMKRKATSSPVGAASASSSHHEIKRLKT